MIVPTLLGKFEPMLMLDAVALIVYKMRIGVMLTPPLISASTAVTTTGSIANGNDIYRAGEVGAIISL